MREHPREEFFPKDKEATETSVIDFEKRPNAKNIFEDPRVSIDIYYSSHDTPHDIRGLDQALEKTDVFIQELMGWTPIVQEVFQDVSDGKETSEDALRDIGCFNKNSATDFTRELLEKLYKSRKKILFIDAPADHEIEIYTNRLLMRSRPAIKLTKSLEENSKSLKFYLEKLAILQGKREDYMISALKKQTVKLLEENPKFQKKNSIKVLLLLGSAHTGVYHQLSKMSAQTSRQFSTYPYIFDYGYEALRNYMFGKEVNSELMARAVFEEILFNALIRDLNRITDDTDKKLLFFRRAVAQFSYNEINDIFNVNRDNSDAKKILLLELSKKNISVPQSEKELDMFLKI